MTTRTNYPHTGGTTCICEPCTQDRHGRQNRFNLLASSEIVIPAELREDIHEAIARGHEDLSQYDGMWDDWTLVEITQTIRTKLGTAFEKGDITLARYEKGLGLAYPGRWTAHSIRNGINTDIGSAAREIATFEVIRTEHGTGRTELWTRHTSRLGADRALADAPKDRQHWYTIQPALRFDG